MAPGISKQLHVAYISFGGRYRTYIFDHDNATCNGCGCIIRKRYMSSSSSKNKAQSVVLLEDDEDEEDGDVEM